VGVPLGILIGLVSGGVAIILIRTAWQTSGLKGTVQVVGQLLAIPTFWFGGPWLTSSLLASVEPIEIRTSYVLSLAAVFVPLAGWPIVKLSYDTGRRIGAQRPAPERSGDDA
jgi:hypothetical protein